MNFSFHRTQVAVDQAINKSFEVKINDVKNNSLLVKSKEQLTNDLMNEFSEKL